MILTLSPSERSPEDLRPYDLRPEDLAGPFLEVEPGVKVGECWIPARFDPPRRAAVNVKAVTGLAVDLDHLSAERYRDILQALSTSGLECYLYETFSHAPPEDCRVRIIFPFEVELPLASPSQWPPVRAALLARLGLTDADPATADPSRLYYSPRCPPGETRQTAAQAGPRLDWRTVPVPAALPRAAAVTSDEEDPTRPVDLDDVRRRLARVARGTRPAAPFVASLLRGEPLAPHGERHNAWLKALGVLGDVAFAWESTEALLSLCDSSRQAEITATPDAPHPLSALEDMLRSGRATAEQRRADRAAREQSFRDALLRHRHSVATANAPADNDLGIPPAPVPEDDGLEVVLQSVNDRRTRERLRTAFADPEERALWPTSFDADAELAAVALVNAAGFSVLDKGSEVVVARFASPEGDSTERKLHQLSLRAFRELLLAHTVADDAGKPRPLADVWLRSPGALHHTGVVVEADARRAPPKALNLWQGLAVAPKGGPGTERVHELIHALAGHDDRAAEYLLKWCAWSVQNPTTRSETAVALRGPEGCGKSTLGEAILTPCFGSHARHLTREEDLTGRFNSRLAGACFVLADEVFVVDPKASERLKTLVTSATIDVEAKGRDPVPVPNVVKIMLTTNREQALRIETRGRRYLVCDCADYHSSGSEADRLWWVSFYDYLDSGGRAAFLAELLAMDLSRFAIRDVPQTAATHEDRAASQPAAVQWLAQSVTAGPGTGLLGSRAYRADGERVTVNPVEALEEIAEHARAHRGTTPTHVALSRLLARAGGTAYRPAGGPGGSRPRVYRWESEASLRAGLARAVGIPEGQLFGEVDT